MTEAVVGGCYFRNVAVPLSLDDEPVLTLGEADGRTIVRSAAIYSENELIAEVHESEVSILTDSDRYLIESTGQRTSIVDRQRAAILYDEVRRSRSPTLRLALQTAVGKDLPVFFHPDRIRIGTARILRPHLQSLRLSTTEGSQGAAIRIRDLHANAVPSGAMMNPATPMVGVEGVVQRMAVVGEEEESDDDSVLKMTAPNRQDSGIVLSGPCYLKDMGFVNVNVAIDILPPTEKADGASAT